MILRVTDNDNVSNTNTMILTITLVEAAICGDVTGDNNVTMGDTRRIEMWLLYPVTIQSIIFGLRTSQVMER